MAWWRSATWRPTLTPTTTRWPLFAATFRCHFLPELEQLFVQVLLAREMKLLTLGTIAWTAPSSRPTPASTKRCRIATLKAGSDLRGEGQNEKRDTYGRTRFRHH